MNNLQVFNYKEKEVRTTEQDNQTWWIAQDVCEVLELSDVSMSLQRLGEDEKLIQKLFVSGQNRDVWTINEPGLYSLILTSNKPEAKAFKRWITHEVIPSLRKTGSYSMPSGKKDKELQMRIDKESRLLAREKRLSAQFFKEVIDDFSSVLSPASIQQAVYEISTMLFDKGIIERPALESRLYSAGEIGQEIGVSANKIGRVANHHGLKTEENGMMVMDKSKYSEKQVSTFMYNEKGKTELIKILSEVKGE